jgi:peptide/nickel transport system substrate-binding protein
MVSRTRTVILIGAGIAAVVAVIGARDERRDVRSYTTARVRGGEIVVSIRTEPRSFNCYLARDITTAILATLTQATLVRVNRVTDDIEPWLATSWTRSDDGLRYTLRLQPNITFSDGHSFSADDVVFSFAAAYDERTPGPVGDSIMIDGKKLQVAALDPLTVAVTFPSPFAAGLRLLDHLPILPRHKLQGSLDAGRFSETWSVTTPPSQVVGLGPFLISDYQPGQRLAFTRNPYYWRKDADGIQLPYLDRMTLEILTDQNAELLRLDSGQIDMTSSEIRPEDYLPLKRAADAGRVRLVDLGVGMDADGLWFNLKPGAFAGDPRATWLQRDELRHAVSMAVDRKLLADTVFLGAGVPIAGVETPANTRWYSATAPQMRYDPAGARALLSSIGITGDHPGRFTLLTPSTSTATVRAAAVLREELKRVGLLVDVVTLEPSAVVQSFLSGKYDAVYFRFLRTDPDPAMNLDFWFSRGSAHVWNISQRTASTEWERRIDELMSRQIAASHDGERKRLYDDVQRIFGEHLPIVFFAAPRVYIAASSRMKNLEPAVRRPQLLWSPDTLAVHRGETH